MRKSSSGSSGHEMDSEVTFDAADFDDDAGAANVAAADVAGDASAGAGVGAGTGAGVADDDGADVAEDVGFGNSAFITANRWYVDLTISYESRVKFFFFIR